MMHPAPLVPAKVDLRSYDWFPFHHKRLRQSAFWKRASDLACRVSVDLWAEAYEQVPAASLPDDDHLLSDWAGFGRRDLAAWLAVKDEVMGAWTLCSDGRWYHPTLSEVALQAWLERRLHLWSRECDRIRKENLRRAKNGLMPLEAPPKPSDDPFDDVADLAVSDGNLEPSTGHPPESDASSGRPVENIDNPAENALTRTRTRTIKKESLSLCSRDASANVLAEDPADKPVPRSKPPRKHPYPPAAFDRWYDGYPHKVGRGAAERSFTKVLASDAVAFDVLCHAVERYRRSKPADREWCNPATWLNQARWADEPATPTAPPSALVSIGTIDFGNGCSAPRETIRKVWGRGDWPTDWGPKPGQPGCRVPGDVLAEILRRAA